MAAQLNLNLNGEIALFVGDPHSLAPVSKAWKEVVDQKLYPHFFKEYCEVESLGGYIAEALQKHPEETACRARILAVFQKLRREGKTMGGFHIAGARVSLHPRTMKNQGEWIALMKAASLVLMTKRIFPHVLAGKNGHCLDLERPARQWLTDERNKTALKEVATIRLEGLGLRTLSSQVALFSNVAELNLGQNNLISLPAELFNLRELRFLTLSDNMLTSLPPEIGNLTKLQSLIVPRNKLASLPDELARISSLNYLSISDNLFTRLPIWTQQIACVSDNNPIAQDPPPSRNESYFPPLPPLSPKQEKKAYTAKVEPAVQPQEATPSPAPTLCEQVAGIFYNIYCCLTERLTALYRFLFSS
jgi:hypothetical protein